MSDIAYPNIFDQHLDDDYDRCLIDDMAAWYSDPKNFPDGLPVSWRYTWDHTFSSLSGQQDREIILESIKNGSLMYYDQGDVYNGLLIDKYFEKKTDDDSFFYDLSLYPEGLPASWRMYWLYLVEREWCKPICNVIIEAIKRNDLHNCHQDVAVVDSKKFCEDANKRWGYN
jgi:hypothetical protein